jgi:hypothetical protein
LSLKQCHSRLIEARATLAICHLSTALIKPKSRFQTPKFILCGFPLNTLQAQLS